MLDDRDLTSAPPGDRRPLTVVVADDHALFRAGLRHLLAPHGIEVLGEAADGAEALAQAQRLRPDAMLMDLDMPGVGGLAATRQADVPVVVLTGSSDTDKVLEALGAGAAGFVLKDAGAEHIAAALKAALRGEAAFDGRVAQRLAEHVREQRDGATASAPVELTEREQAVLRVLATGADNRAIGEALGLGASTVKDHVGRVLAKLGVDNRVQAAVWATRRGLLED